MTSEFKKIISTRETRYVLETTSAGATGSAVIASAEKPLGELQKRQTVSVPVNQKPRQGPLRPQTGGGAHRDKKKEQKQGKEKHRKPFAEQGVAEGSSDDLVYISVDRVEAFEDWMDSEGLETNVPKTDEGTYVVYDYSNADYRSKMYASDWNEKKGVAEGYKNTYNVGDRVDGPLGTGTIVAVSKNVNVDGRVKVKLDDPSKAGEDGKYKDSFVLTTTQLKHISEQGVAEGTDQELVKRQVSYWDQVAKEKKNKEREALKAKKAEYEKTPAGKAEKYWDQVAKEKGEEERAARRAKKAEYEKTPAGKAEKYWSQKGVAEGSNSSPFDQMANLKSKSNKELDELVRFWQRSLEKNPNHKVANDQLHLIKMIRAERIGKKGVAEGYREFDELRDRIDRILIKAYNRYGTRDEVINAAKPAAMKAAQELGAEKYFKEVWMNALASHDVDTDFGDNDDGFDYTDYSMRKGERGMEEGSEQGVAEGPLNELSKDTLKSYTKKANDEVNAIKKKQADHPRGHISGADADKKLNRQIGINQATKRIVKKDLTGVEEGGLEPDHEISMASNELQSIVSDAKKLLVLIKRYSEMEGLEAWQQSKITKATDYIASVLRSIGGDQGVLEGLKDPKDNPCWKGYKPVGTKQKGGRTVPNCVPKESLELNEYETHTYKDSQGNVWRVDDEGNKELVKSASGGYGSGRSSYGRARPSPGYSRPKGMYFYNVKPGQENDAMQAGLKQSKSGKWYSSYQNSNADKMFGPGRYWEPKNEGMIETDYMESLANSLELALQEKAPEGWEGTVKSMKKHKDIDNPWALAHWMNGQGYKSHKSSKK